MKIFGLNVISIQIEENILNIIYMKQIVNIKCIYIHKQKLEKREKVENYHFKILCALGTILLTIRIH